MTFIIKRPPVQPTFSAHQFDGVSAEAFVRSLHAGASCTIRNTGYGLLKHEVSIELDGQSVRVEQGQWVVYGEGREPRLLNDEEFRAEFVPANASVAAGE
ncbi:hypothetical protein ACI2KS_10245 [Pseudomonas sp. NPDC087358]|uniref:hypothetical protein n=1 Tax=Pseudomonas sp. NPDC087358 TaxID=3364439 RepID=UPI00384B7929